MPGYTKRSLLGHTSVPDHSTLIRFMRVLVLQILLSKNITLVTDSKLVRPQRLLDRTLRLEDDIELFECSVLCLRHSVVHDDRLYSIPDNEDNIRLYKLVSMFSCVCKG